jgi:hypothetical protein
VTRLLLLLLAPAVALAHGLDPASLALRETRAGVFEVRWKASALRLPGANVQPVLPARCRRIGGADAVDETDRVTLRWTVDCGADGARRRGRRSGRSVRREDQRAPHDRAPRRDADPDGARPADAVVHGPGAASRWDVVRGYARSASSTS